MSKEDTKTSGIDFSCTATLHPGVNYQRASWQKHATSLWLHRIEVQAISFFLILPVLNTQGNWQNLKVTEMWYRSLRCLILFKDQDSTNWIQYITLAIRCSCSTLDISCVNTPWRRLGEGEEKEGKSEYYSYGYFKILKYKKKSYTF